MTDAIELHTNDNVTIEIPVISSSDGSAKALPGASVTCKATNLKTGTSVIPAALIADEATGLASVQLNPGSLVPGQWVLQVRVTLATGDSQIVFDRVLNVKKNY